MQDKKFWIVALLGIGFVMLANAVLMADPIDDVLRIWQETIWSWGKRIFRFFVGNFFVPKTWLLVLLFELIIMFRMVNKSKLRYFWTSPQMELDRAVSISQFVVVQTQEGSNDFDC